MSQRKAERQLNLLICLLSARRYLERERIRDLVEGYRDLNDAAFQRTFERDKDELRAMGVPVETGSNDPFFDDEIGYRIRRDDFELPPLDFTAEERIVLGLAAGVFAGAALSDRATAAIGKLRAAGIEPDPGRLAAVTATVATREPAFPVLWDAVSARRRVRFDYRTSGATRTVEPWSMLHRNGSWYVMGRDADRDEPRMFKLSRVVGEAVAVGQPGVYEPPSPEAYAGAVRRLEPARAGQTVAVAVRGESAPVLRRRGRPSSRAAPGGFTAYDVEYGSADELAAEVAAAGADALVLDDGEVKDLVLQALRAVAARTPVKDLA